MVTLERKVGIARMIEVGVGPRTGLVAGLTLFATATVVMVVLGVTTETRCWCILVRRIVVAVRALRLTMLAN